MIVHTKMPYEAKIVNSIYYFWYEVPNDVIMYHEKRMEWNILISACMPYKKTFR